MCRCCLTHHPAAAHVSVEAKLPQIVESMEADRELRVRHFERPIAVHVIRLRRPLEAAAMAVEEQQRAQRDGQQATDAGASHDRRRGHLFLG